MMVEVVEDEKVFLKIVTDLSAVLYPHHQFNNLQCHEPIDSQFEKGFVLYNNKQIIATACLIKNEKLRFKGEDTICIAFYECIDCFEASNEILFYVFSHCRLQGYNYIIGPMNGSTWKSYRFTKDRHEDSYITEPFHKGYYAAQFKQAGFEIAAEYITQIAKVQMPDDIFVDKKLAITYRAIDKQQFEKELKRIFDFCNHVFRKNFLFTEINEITFLEKYLTLKDLITADFVLLAEHKGKVVGLLFALHDYYCQHEKRLVVKTLARKYGAEYTEVARELTRKIVQIALKHNYNSMLHAFMLKSNTSKSVSDSYFGNLFRTYQLFYKELK